MVQWIYVGALVTMGAPLAAAEPLIVPAPPVAATGAVVLPPDTPIDFEITDQLGSKRSRTGEAFHFRLLNPIVVQGMAVIPEGTTGIGEVVHAARARAMGKAGELILAARYIDMPGARVALRGFRFGRSGDMRTDTAFAVGIVGGLLAAFVVGGEIEIPPGTIGHARTKSETIITPVQAPR